MSIDNTLNQLIGEHARRGRFDSHDVVNAFRTRYAAEYGSQLAAAERRAEQRALRREQKKKPSAVHCLHTALGIRIARLSKVAGLKRTESRSRDVNGQQSCCLSWSANRPC
jgi:hypothetical protein